jgi:hypothetical protein
MLDHIPAMMEQLIAARVAQYDEQARSQLGETNLRVLAVQSIILELGDEEDFTDEQRRAHHYLIRFVNEPVVVSTDWTSHE